MSKRRILVTSALPYANAPLHLGHVLEAVQTDIWVRYQRLRGHECHYVCADDAHGTAIMLKAEEAGISPEQHIESIKQSHQADFQAFLISVDNYYSTHSEENRTLAESIYQTLEANGHIVKREITQAYDEEKGLFLADRFIKGTCPRCKTPDQYGDNCENCGATYAPGDLIDSVSVLSGAKPVQKQSLHYFFDLPQFESFLQEWLQSGNLQPEIARKLNEWMEAGLQAWDISRDAPYFGFKIPGTEDKFFYVWLDAPIGYMASFTNYADRSGLDFDDFWRDGENTELYHFIGKDIINFHGLFWPAMLKSAGYRLPTGVFAHGFVTVNGTKMSKSRGTFINAGDYLKHLPAESIRYYYAAKLSDGIDDIDLNLEDFVQRVNSDLVGKVVNIASRCAGFIHKLNGGKLSDQLCEAELWERFIAAEDLIADFYEKRQFSRAVREIMALADLANEYIAETEPWKLVKNPDTEVAALDSCTMGINLFRLLITYLTPILPSTSEASAEFLNCDISWRETPEPLLGHPIAKFKPLMKRIEWASVEALLAENRAPTPVVVNTTDSSSSTANESEDMQEISIDDFQRVRLQVAEVETATLVEGADKLLKLELNLGDHKRTVFSGIRAHYNPEELIGRKVVAVTNLKPRKMKFGISEGMVLCAESGNGLHLIETDQSAEPGSVIS